MWKRKTSKNGFLGVRGLWGTGDKYVLADDDDDLTVTPVSREGGVYEWKLRYTLRVADEDSEKEVVFYCGMAASDSVGGLRTRFEQERSLSGGSIPPSFRALLKVVQRVCHKAVVLYRWAPVPLAGPEYYGRWVPAIEAVMLATHGYLANLKGNGLPPETKWAAFKTFCVDILGVEPSSDELKLKLKDGELEA